MENNAGFEELEHTADWQLRVWGEDFTALLHQAAIGMQQLMGVELENLKTIERVFELQGIDSETLLVAFLSELLMIGENEGYGFVEFHFEMNDDRLKVRAFGGVIKSQQKEIKAVTFHNLEISPTSSGLVTEIVFDV